MLRAGDDEKSPGPARPAARGSSRFARALGEYTAARRGRRHGGCRENREAPFSTSPARMGACPSRPSTAWRARAGDGHPASIAAAPVESQGRAVLRAGRLYLVPLTEIEDKLPSSGRASRPRRAAESAGRPVNGVLEVRVAVGLRGHASIDTTRTPSVRRRANMTNSQAFIRGLGCAAAHLPVKVGGQVPANGPAPRRPALGLPARAQHWMTLECVSTLPVSKTAPAPDG